MFKVPVYLREVGVAPDGEIEGNDDANPTNELGHNKSEGSGSGHWIELLLDVMEARHTTTHHGYISVRTPLSKSVSLNLFVIIPQSSYPPSKKFDFFVFMFVVNHLLLISDVKPFSSIFILKLRRFGAIT